MVKIRIFVLAVTFIVVTVVAYFLYLYAKGYRLNQKSLSLTPNGLLVIKSDPDGASIFINNELKTATNATIPLAPDTYDVTVSKDGYISWSKRLTIDKEVVTQTTAHLFKSAPSLTAITFSGVTKPVPSYDSAKIAYVITDGENNKGGENSGLWVFEMINLPVGFLREPRRVTDGNLADASYIWSPDGREILLTTKAGSYLLNVSQFTPQAKRVNIGSRREETLKTWKLQLDKKTASKLEKLPDELKSILERKTSSIVFSPDEDMVLYTASGSATIPDDLIPQLPGSSTQKQERDLEKDKTFVYDIKEDRNFLIEGDSSNLVIETGYETKAERRISWLPTSRHLILAKQDKITIMDYDGTNRQVVYNGSYISPSAFPTLSTDRLIILTNFGSSTALPNLYFLGIK